MSEDHEKILQIIRLKDAVPFKLELDRTALIVIDVQRYFVSPCYALTLVHRITLSYSFYATGNSL